MPQGTYWTPVDTALAVIKAQITPIVAEENLPLSKGAGRILAKDMIALRSNPPHANSAVDGYGFAHAITGDGPQNLPLIAGRAAAGAPYSGSVPAGSAIRILTGAILPKGVDTVVLEEDTTTNATHVTFQGALRLGANARKAGEDIQVGDVALSKGRPLTPADLALLSATGHGAVPIRKRLRVAVISTGDELREAGAPVVAGQIHDANLPMLVSVLERWGYEVVDLGRQPDDPDVLRGVFDHAANVADVVLTSGGASAGDEDHVSALLTGQGGFSLWRIAVKPGRPLALGLWNGTPIFGLPGNPVAALVCTLVFARPALAQLAGADWSAPQGFDVPAAFAKSKKEGRREYLRARMRNGQVEVFKSEGSGRISGLSWAEGLVELPDGEADIQRGDPVRYIPFGSFGL
jgi:molybdopterin molybdotransferase